MFAGRGIAHSHRYGEDAHLCHRSDQGTDRLDGAAQSQRNHRCDDSYVSVNDIGILQSSWLIPRHIRQHLYLALGLFRVGLQRFTDNCAFGSHSEIVLFL